MVRLSILIPVFNESRYIEECIDSVLKNKSRDFEIIVSDNHSTDDTIDRLRKYNDDRLKIVQPPARLAPQRNHWHAFQNSCGSYIYFIGGDDYLVPGIIDECIGSLDGETILFGPMEIFYDGSTDTRAIYNDKNTMGIIGEGGLAFVRNYLRRLNHDEIVYAFVPRALFANGLGLCDYSLETMFPWIAMLFYFTGAKHIRYFDKTIFRKRYKRIHSAGDFASDAFTSSFVKKTAGSLYNSVYTAIKLKSAAVLLLLLFFNRGHDTTGGLFGRFQRTSDFWFPSPVLMSVASPLLDLWRYFFLFKSS